MILEYIQMSEHYVEIDIMVCQLDLYKNNF